MNDQSDYVLRLTAVNEAMDAMRSAMKDVQWAQERLDAALEAYSRAYRALLESHGVNVAEFEPESALEAVESPF